MLILSCLPIVCSAVLLAAHFYRGGILFLTVVSMLTPLLLCWKNRWIPRLLTVFLFLAAVEWLKTMLFFIGKYEETGHSWTRLSIILSSVSLFTALSPLVFRTKAMQKRYRLAGTGATESPPAS